MAVKTKRQYTDHRCGFPVRITGVSVIKDAVGEIVLLDNTAFRKAVLDALVKKRGRLTGKEVRFIRLSLEMTLAGFAGIFGLTHPAVKKWEEHGDEATDMRWPCEQLMRVVIASTLDYGADELKQLLLQLRNSSRYPRLGSHRPLKVSGALVSPYHLWRFDSHWTSEFQHAGKMQHQTSGTGSRNSMTTRARQCWESERGAIDGQEHLALAA